MDFARELERLSQRRDKIIEQQQSVAARLSDLIKMLSLHLMWVLIHILNVGSQPPHPFIWKIFFVYNRTRLLEQSDQTLTRNATFSWKYLMPP